MRYCLIATFAALVAAAPAAAQNLLANPSFDDNAGSPISSWTEVGLGPGYFPVSADSAVPPHSGPRDASHISWLGPPDETYIYQQVNLTAGQEYQFRGWYVCYSGGSESASWHHLQFGVDPTGGTDWSAGTVAKGTDYQVRDGTWRQSDWVLVAVSGSGTVPVTVFCSSSCDDDNGGWWAHAFDDTELVLAPAVLDWSLY